MATDPDWFASWREGRIGFHEGKPNAYLARHAERLTGRKRVLVPLCGKSEDLALLAARGHEVIGIELVEDAVRAFFAEHSLAPHIEPRGPYVAYTHGALTLLAGDFFASDRALLGELDAFYDRAALVAFPPDLRPRYTAHLRGLLAPAAAGLVITLEFDATGWPGPPFPVPEAELRALYANATVEAIDQGNDPKTRAGAPQITERCFAVTL